MTVHAKVATQGGGSRPRMEDGVGVSTKVGGWRRVSTKEEDRDTRPSVGTVFGVRSGIKGCRRQWQVKPKGS